MAATVPVATGVTISGVVSVCAMLPDVPVMVIVDAAGVAELFDVSVITLIPEVLAYEGEAARYGLTLFHQTGITDVDQWFSNYTSADQAYLLHFYRTCDKGEFKNFWRENAPLVEPKAIPPFKPKKRVFRMDGVVI